MESKTLNRRFVDKYGARLVAAAPIFEFQSYGQISEQCKRAAEARDAKIRERGEEHAGNPSDGRRGV